MSRPSMRVATRRGEGWRPPPAPASRRGRLVALRTLRAVGVFLGALGGGLAASAVARAQESTATFGPSEGGDSAEGGSEAAGADAEPKLGPEGRELKPYVRPPYVAPSEEAKRRSRASRRRQSIRNHDGLYARAAAGMGIGTDTITGANYSYGFDDRGGQRGHVSAFEVPTELAVGATPFRGTVLGVGVYTGLWPSPRANGEDPGLDYEFDTSQLALYAPMVDFYPRPRAGWHVQGALGVASVNLGFGSTGLAEPRPAQAHVTTGFGFMLGAGHEWFIGEQWSVGILLRTLRGYSAGTDAGGGEWTHRSGSYALLVTLTYH